MRYFFQMEGDFEPAFHYRPSYDVTFVLSWHFVINHLLTFVVFSAHDVGRGPRSSRRQYHPVVRTRLESSSPVPEEQAHITRQEIQVSSKIMKLYSFRMTDVQAFIFYWKCIDISSRFL